MKPAVPLKSVEWHEPAYKVDGSITLADADRPSPFEDEDDEDRESSVRERAATEPLLPAAPEAESAPDHVGPYRLIERIGSGAMGHVYRAEHTLLGRVVAIKMLRAELTCEEACVRRFLAEARAVNLIKHEHIIDVTDFACTSSGQPWFVMEMLEGSDLSLAASHEALSLPRTLEIMRQLCEALAAVHTAGVVHRDVKPENIFLTRRDDKDFVSLLDFGIARLPDPTSADPLQEGLMGTPHYMAPEQIQASPIDHRADLYAVGSTLFELVAGIGRTPFRATTLQKQLMDVLMEPAPRLSDRAKVPAIVREELDSLVARCLAKQPCDRPASAREIADELVAIAAKLEGRVSGSQAVQVAQAEAPTLMLRGADLPVVSLPVVAETRKRARRELRARRAWSSRSATVLSAVAAAAAMWVATSETSWAHALSRVTSWRAVASMASASSPAHVAAPATHADAVLNAHVAEPAVDVAAPAVLIAAVPKASHIDSSLGMDEPEAVVESATAQGSPAVDVPDEEHRARKAARAKARMERETPFEQPALVITPSSSQQQAPEPQADVDDVADEEPSYDRDLVLNPFSE